MTSRCRLLAFCALLAFSVAIPSIAATTAATLPDGPGKKETVLICGKCHSPERAAALHQGRREWARTIARMVAMGANGTDQQLNTVLDYLSKNFPQPPPAPVNINTADPVDLEARLLLLRSQATAVIEYRETHGAFKSLDDLRNVPGLDFNKIEQEKARIVF